MFLLAWRSSPRSRQSSLAGAGADADDDAFDDAVDHRRLLMMKMLCDGGERCRPKP